LHVGRLDEAAATLEEADSLVTANHERFWESELLRLRGEIAAARGRRDDGTAMLNRAIEIARGQGAKSLERRAMASLERMGAS
jgi:predicted negative regulator of RcsB-dependent stress response